MILIYQRHSMPKSLITKSDFVNIPLCFFAELFQCIQGTQCQSHGSQNQTLFVFHFVLFCELSPRIQGAPCQSHRRQIRTTKKLEIKIKLINMSPAMATIRTIILITTWITIIIKCNTRPDITHQTRTRNPTPH